MERPWKQIFRGQHPTAPSRLFQWFHARQSLFLFQSTICLLLPQNFFLLYLLAPTPIESFSYIAWFVSLQIYPTKTVRPNQVAGLIKIRCEQGLHELRQTSKAGNRGPPKKCHVDDDLKGVNRIRDEKDWNGTHIYVYIYIDYINIDYIYIYIDYIFIDYKYILIIYLLIIYNILLYCNHIIHVLDFI